MTKWTPEQHAQLAVALGLSASADFAGVLATVEGNGQDARALTAIARELGCDEGASADEMLRACRGMAVAAASAQEAEQEAATLRVNSQIDAARTAGKITPANEGFARSLAAKDPEMFAEFIAATHAVVPTHAQRAGASGGATSEEAAVACAIRELSATELTYIAKAPITAEQYVKANDLHRSHLAQ